MPLQIFKSDEDAHADMMARGADCKSCPLFGEHQGPVPSALPPDAKLIGIGEAPGKHEVKRGKPFVGDSGDELSFGLSDGGLRRLDTALINVLACKPPDDLQWYLTTVKRKGLKSPIDCCRPRFVRDVEDAQKTGCRTALVMGATAHEAIAQVYGIPVGAPPKRKGKPAHSVKEYRVAAISEQRGHPYELKHGSKSAAPHLAPMLAMPSLHPAYALRKAHNLLHVIREDIASAARVARLGWAGYSLPPDMTVGKRSADIFAWLDTAERSGQRVTVDIETDGLDSSARIRCIGLGYYVDSDPATRPRIMVIPITRKAGGSIWPVDIAGRLKARLRLFFDRVRLAAHNGAFDTKVLLANGYMTDRRKTWFDTAIAHHVSIECDAPHDLAFVSSRFGLVPLWKFAVDHKAVDTEQPDEDLWHYNAIDVDQQANAFRGLSKWVKDAANTDAFVHDSRKAPICRDMGELGLYIDGPRRERMNVDLLAMIADRTAKLREIAEWPDYNPNSGPQTAKYLFDKMGWTPIANTKGDEWEEGDNPAASIDALIQLEDSGQLTKQGKEFVNLKIEHAELFQLWKMYVNGMVKYLRPTKWDGIYHLPVSFHVHTVVSGRLSSNPNVQNWPTSGKLNMRELCIAPPGHVIVGADYEQIEARIYAVQSGDAMLLDAFAKGLDVHSYNAAVLFAEKGATQDRIFEIYTEILRCKKAYDKDSKEQLEAHALGPARSGLDAAVFAAISTAKLEKKKAKQRRDAAKTYVYQRTFGGGEEGVGELMRKKREKGTGKRMFPNLTTEGPDSDVARWTRNWDTYHPEGEVWHDTIKAYVRKHGCVADGIIGRKRHFPGGPTQVLAPANHTIQGTSAAITDLALIELDSRIGHRVWSPYSGLFSQVHDWIGAYVPEGRAAEAVRIFDEVMPYTFRGMLIPVKALATRTLAAQSE